MKINQQERSQRKVNSKKSQTTFIKKNISKYSSVKKYLRVINYLSAVQLYLLDNFFLERELGFGDIKHRLLGHWGGVTGVNFIYAHLNFYLKENQKTESRLKDVMFMLGPGHAFPALQANLFLEKTLSDFFGDDKKQQKRIPKNILDFKVGYNKQGLENLIKYFGTSEGFPTHASPITPGAILEGGELGYSIANANGSVLDNPDLVTICVIGDGEFETASLATGLHANKFVNSKTNGVVLPIINLNGYKISGPTILGRMADEDLKKLFEGYGYTPYILDARSETGEIKNKDNYDLEKDNVHILMQQILENSFQKIFELKKTGEVKDLPIILLKSDKGWTGPKYIKENGKNIKVEGNFYSHQVPFSNAKNNYSELKELEKWLKSYKIEELLIDLNPTNIQDRFKESGELFLKEIEDIIPEKFYRMGQNIHIQQNGKGKLKELSLPTISSINNLLKDESFFSPMEITGEYLKQVFKLNERTKNFRFFSPDETYSNKLSKIFEEESRSWTGEMRPWDKDMSKNGRVIEMLSENTLIGMMMGYILTGRHAWFASYEAFVQIIASMIDQYLKFLRVSLDIKWRGDLAGFNIILTASSWAQEHNGYSHQNPGFIDDMLLRNTDLVDIYLPMDAMATVYAVNEMMGSKNKINILVAAKDKRPILLTKEEAEKSIKEKMIFLEKYSDIPDLKNKFDFLIVAAGDYVSLEALAGIDLFNKLFLKIFSRNKLRDKRNKFKIGFLNIAILGAGERESQTENNFEEKLKELIGQAKVFASFHGHPQTFERYFYEAGIEKKNLEVRGYIERGGIATLLEMHILNKTSRYDVVEYLLKNILEMKRISQTEFELIMSGLNLERIEEETYIKENFVDSERIRSWAWGKFI